MANEKMRILKMLQDGAITADEAARLLEASDAGASSAPGQGAGSSYSQSTYSAEASRPSPDQGQGNGARPSGGFTSHSTEGPRPYGSQSSGQSGPRPSGEGFTEDLTRKFEVLMKDLEPKLQRFTEVVAEKTAQAADKLSKTFATTGEPGAYRPSGGASRPAPGAGPSPRPQEHPKAKSAASGMGKGYEKNIELRVNPGYNELVIAGMNAPVLLKGYNGDKISAKLLCVPKRNNPRIELSVLGSKYFLDYDEDDFEKVAIDAFIPESLFKNISVTNYNGDVNLSTLEAGFISLYASNGSVELSGLSAENIKVECENGREMRIDTICAENAMLENFNGNISATNIDVANLKISSFNGAMNLHITEFKRYADYTWVVETSNHKLNVNLPTLTDVGYYIKAKTSLGNVKVGLTGLNYLFNSPGMIEAQTIEFDRLPKKVRISLETSNASLTVN